MAQAQGLEHDTITLLKSYGLSAVLSQIADIYQKKVQHMNLQGGDGICMEVLIALLLTTAQQASKAPRTVHSNTTSALTIEAK
jgi:hypothetical protein